GSLSKRVLDILLQGGRVAGMVIDEQGDSHDKTSAQKDMLRKLAEWGCPIILVELNPSWRSHQSNEPPQATKPTNRELRLAAGARFKRVIKGYGNAMVQTDLKEKLQATNFTRSGSRVSTRFGCAEDLRSSTW